MKTLNQDRDFTMPDIDDDVVPAATLKQRIQDALEIPCDYGHVDGAHHKQWIIDQMLQRLLGDDYQEFVGEGWDTGVAP